MTKPQSKTLLHSVSVVGGPVFYAGAQVSGQDLAVCEKAGASFAKAPKKSKEDKE